MASAQVLPNSAASSRKQELLDAGKRRLEEFRKKKAAGRSKKAGSAGQPPIADSVANEKLLSNGKIHVPDSDGAVASGRTGDPIGESNIVVANDAEHLHIKTSVSSVGPEMHTYADPTVLESQIPFSSDLPPAWTKQEEHQRTNVSGSIYQINIEPGQHKYDEIGDYGTISTKGRSWDMASSDQYNDYGHRSVKDAPLDIIDGSNEIPRARTSYNDGSDIVSSGRSGSFFSQTKPDSTPSTISSLPYASDFGQSLHENSDSNKHVMSEMTERKPVYDNLPSFHRVANEESHASSQGYNFGERDSTSQVSSQSATHDAYPRRNRPSFLDSLNIPRVSSTSRFSNSQLQLVPDDVAVSASHNHFGGKGNLESDMESAHSHGNYNDNSFPDQNIYVNHVERNLDLPQKQNEDFDALEQHIEDLTQEKFSLQRALEASKTLSESLAAENSSLTESYNQQGGVVAQLKSEMENLQAQIKALLAEHESISIQYANVQLECNAADERAKLLASEVIGLEEKSLRLRSNELKLEKELEKSNAEVAACKKKMLSLEKERQDLHMRIDALQEEKKLLHSKFRKTSASGLFFDQDEQKSKKNVSTSTGDLEDLHGGNAQPSPSSIAEDQHASAASLPQLDNLQLLQQSRCFGFDGSATIIPSDQMQMIQNINALLSELKLEKEELSRALVAEISTCLKLKDSNKELSQRLDAQTQRLELLTAQSMAKDNVVARQPTNSQIVQENMAYADEGDEVVERVLGWIMKLFPGGPSRRRTSKLI